METYGRNNILLVRGMHFVGAGADQRGALHIYIYIYTYIYIYSTVGVPHSYPLCDLLRRKIGQGEVCMCSEATRADDRIVYDIKWHENAFAMMAPVSSQPGNKRARTENSDANAMKD